jgi:hypothetical protein
MQKGKQQSKGYENLKAVIGDYKLGTDIERAG